MLHTQDHTRHPIILRQIPTLLREGFTVSVVDVATESTENENGCRRTSVRAVRLGLLRTWLWKLLRPLAPGRLPELYWTTLVCTELLLTTLRIFWAAYRYKADVYQAHDLWALLAGVVASRMRGARVVYDAHELASDQGDRRQFYYAFLRFLERMLIPLADTVIVPNGWRGAIYQLEHQLNRDPIVVLNCPPFEPVQRTSRLREALSLPNVTRIVLYHGTMMVERALEELVKSVDYFDPDIALVLVGEQNEYYERALGPLVGARSHTGRVFAVPFVPPSEIASFVASADLGVVIYKNTNRNNYLCAPTKLYEFVMADVPIVACDFPELVAFTSEYPVGLTFNSSDPRSIASAVNQFFRLNAQTRAAMSAQLERARHRFNWESESPKLVSALRSLTATPEHGGLRAYATPSHADRRLP